MSSGGFLHAFLVAAAGTLLLWLNVTSASPWVTIFSVLLVLFLVFSILFDPERIWRRIGSTLIAAALVPSGVTAALSIAGFVKFSGSFQVLSAPEWLLLLFGSIFLFLDGVWIRIGAMWGKGFWPTALRQELRYQIGETGTFVATGPLYVESNVSRDFKVYGADARDFWWMGLFRTVKIDDKQGFVVKSGVAWYEPKNERPVELGRRKSIDCYVRIQFQDGRLLKFTRNCLKWLPGKFGQSVSTVVRVRFVGSQLSITVSAAQEG